MAGGGLLSRAVPGIGVKTADKVVAMAREYMKENEGVSAPDHATDETLDEVETSFSESPEPLDEMDDRGAEEKVAVQAYGSDEPHDRVGEGDGAGPQDETRGLEERKGTGGES